MGFPYPQAKTNVPSQLIETLGQSLGPDRFPFFCGHLIALFVAFRAIMASSILRSGIANKQQRTLLLRLSTFISAASASWLSLPLLNSPTRRSARSASAASMASRPARSESISSIDGTVKAGHTLDLTLLLTVRATEILVSQAWHMYLQRRPRTPSRTRARIEQVLSVSADPALFIASAGTVMWTWFYEPHKLPHGYSKWITSAAQVDPRLIKALQAARAGTFVYGKDNGAAGILSPMCDEHNWPQAWGDPARTIPVPCEMVHMGQGGSSCHAHALVRFTRSFRFAFQIYMPLQLLLRLRSSPTLHWRRKVLAALREATRSSSFLASFIALFYYAVCLSRSVVGPRLFPRHLVSPQAWDSGLCVAAGCAACGWSVLLEKPRRRQELAGFVAPRALATYVPRRYERVYFPRERAAFAASLGVLAVAIQTGPHGVRGWLGSVLSSVMK